MRGGLLTVVYLIIGLVIAGSHHYLRHLGQVRGLGSALLAIVLWPLVLLGVSLHIH
jgi:hypothetical protein